MHLKLTWCGETYTFSDMTRRHKKTFLYKTHAATTTILQTVELVR